MTIPRALHKLYANLMGYFWLPCPVCKKYFGGHETTGASVGSWLICPRCAKNQKETPWDRPSK